MEHERPKVGVGVIILKEGKVLLCERLASHGAGSYSLPGGHMEHGESFEDTARREVEEETGLTDIVVKDMVCVSSDRVYGKHFITIGMTAEWKSGEPICKEPEKAANWKWYGVDELPENLFLPSGTVIEHWRANTIYIPS